MSDLDAIVIGAGHNGLTCAAYLGMAGLRVRVVERRGVVGGAAVTEEFHPGFRNSTAAYAVSLLQATASFNASGIEAADVLPWRAGRLLGRVRQFRQQPGVRSGVR